MILVNNNVFELNTIDTTYVLRVEETKHLISEYYGKRLENKGELNGLYNKWTYGNGCTVLNDSSLSKYGNLDLLMLEESTTGKGDYNSPSIILKNDNGYIFDFLFDKYVVAKKPSVLNNFPTPHKADDELIIYLTDKFSSVTLELHYYVFEKANVIARNIVIVNNGKTSLDILKAMSYQLSLNNNDFEVINLYGGWAGECKKEVSEVKHGTLINDSKTGTSSNRHNPFFMVKAKETTLNSGDIYAFNLIYSGNHYESVERNFIDQVRIMGGISPFCFDYKLNANDRFETPIAVLSYSNKGINGVSQNMHNFVNTHVVPVTFSYKERPILINNWEATYFDFTQAKLLKIAKKAKEVGLELFVLDDGWFGARNNDKAGLGDYNINKKKLPQGLDGFAKKINGLGLKFGLWFEPEMVNVDSDLYRAHPEYAIKHPGFKPSEGRNQLSLNLTLKDVQDYIIKNVSDVLNSAHIEYVKWDYNRNISDFYLENGNSGEFFYRYMIGLYRIFKEITTKFPNILFEGCASGGNRFDLGVLSYFPQIWASDDTDAYERNFIQSGLYLGYPQSTIGAHVSCSPSQSVLRRTPLDTRFNVAAFGCLGYELDLNNLSPVEIKMVKEQIKFYKDHRKLLQFGTLYQYSFMENKNHSEWMVLSEDNKEAVIGYYNGLQKINPMTTTLFASDFNDKDVYKVEVRHQEHNVKEFGGLINQVTPIHLNENGVIVDIYSKHKTMAGESEKYIVSGSLLNSNGLKLKQEWSGTGFDDSVRMLGDFGSRLYYIKAEK